VKEISREHRIIRSPIWQGLEEVHEVSGQDIPRLVREAASQIPASGAEQENLMGDVLGRLSQHLLGHE
jgi:hypothetical protein